jgi:hypothetical protein
VLIAERILGYKKCVAKLQDCSKLQSGEGNGNRGSKLGKNNQKTFGRKGASEYLCRP